MLSMSNAQCPVGIAGRNKTSISPQPLLHRCDTFIKGLINFIQVIIQLLRLISQFLNVCTRSILDNFPDPVTMLECFSIFVSNVITPQTLLVANFTSGAVPLLGSTAVLVHSGAQPVVAAGNVGRLDIGGNHNNVERPPVTTAGTHNLRHNWCKPVPFSSTSLADLEAEN